MCDVYANTIEDELHVLRDCPKAMALWISVVHNGARNDSFEWDLLHWINYNMHSKVIWNHDIDWKDLWASPSHFMELEE